MFFLNPATRFVLFRYFISSFLQKKTRSRAAIGVLLPLVGVAVGMCLLTVVLSIMQGFVEENRHNLLKYTPHLQISPQEDRFVFIENIEDFIENLKKRDPHIRGVAPLFIEDVLVRNSQKALLASLVGVESSAFASVPEISYGLSPTALKSFALQRSPSDPQQKGLFPSLWVGRSLSLGLLGDYITTASLEASESMGNPIQMPFVLAGSFGAGVRSPMGQWMFASLNEIWNYFDAQNLYSLFIISLDNPYDIDQNLSHLKEYVEPLGLKVETWKDLNKSFVVALEIEHWGMVFVLIMIVFVGCFSITITLVLAVKRKGFEIAMLRAMGLTHSQILLMFLYHGAITGILGVFLGLGLGLGILFVLTNCQIPYLAEKYFVSSFPVAIDWKELFVLSCVSVVLATLAALWPALEASRVNPVQVISNRGNE